MKDGINTMTQMNITMHDNDVLLVFFLYFIYLLTSPPAESL